MFCAASSRYTADNPKGKVIISRGCMLLERFVEIVGFRGINRLSLQLEQNNVLIGENARGKSSLLDALTLLLSPEGDLYHSFMMISGFRPAMSTAARSISISF